MTIGTRALDGIGQEAQVVDRVAPGRGHALAVEQPPHDAGSLVEPSDAFARARAELEPVGGVLALEPARTEPDHRATAAQMWSSVVASFAVTAG